LLTNALGLGRNCKAAVFVVPFATGDQFLLCTDGVTAYIPEQEIAEVLTSQPLSSHAAGCLVDLAVARGGGDNATAVVVRIVNAGVRARSPAALDRDRDAIGACPLWGQSEKTISLAEQLRTLSSAFPQQWAAGAVLPVVAFEDRVAWIILDGNVERRGRLCGPGALLYPESLIEASLPSTSELWTARSHVRALALRARDIRELCEEDADLGAKLTTAIAAQVADSKPPVVEDVVIEARPHARGSVPPLDVPGFATRDSASDAALAIALAKLAIDEPSDPDISIEPWIDPSPHSMDEVSTSREPTQPIEILRGNISSPQKR